MIRGQFIDNTPFVIVTLVWQQAVQEMVAKIDTAFDGDIKVSPAKAEELNLKVSHVEKIRVADDRLVDMPSAFAYANFKKMVDSVDVLLAPGDPVVGNSFLKKFNSVLRIDYQQGTVVIS